MQVPLAAFSTPGYCSLCGSWLGKSGIDIPESGGKDDLTSASKQIASIIEILPKIDPATVAMSLRRNINAYCEQVTVSPALIKETLTRALESSAPKALEQIARDLGYAGSGSLRSKFPDLCAAISKKVVDNTQLHYAKVSHALEDALKKNPAPTLAAVARSLGCASNTLQTHESELSSQLLALHRTQLEERKKALVKEAEAALTEVPPPSVRQLCIRLGVNAMTMLGYCPSAMKQLAEQHRLYIANETTRRQEALVSSVLGIATDLAGRNIYPSLPRIVERLPDGHVSDWRFTRRVVLETQRMLASSAGSFQSG